MEITPRASVAPYTTKDGSEIRELAHPNYSRVANQSLAEATVLPGMATQEHYHARTEEIYHILRGAGTMHLAGESREVATGDTIAIRPGERHYVINSGSEPLVFLCCCSPAYSHEDTFLVE